MKTQKNEAGKARQIEVERLEAVQLERRVAPLGVEVPRPINKPKNY
jgi:hypothetical protein